MLNTQRSEEGVGPLFYGGLTDAFNTTIGYFGPTDGDGEGGDPTNGYGEITLIYEKFPLPDGIPYPISCDADPFTYWEGGDL